MADVNPAGTIADARRQATVDTLLASARAHVIEHGLDATMDELADATGVGRRTLFRHFGSRDHLVATAIASGIDRYGERLPTFAGDWRAWLAQLCRTTHEIQSSYGRGYWELITRDDLPDELQAVEDDRRARRSRAMGRIAGKLWREAGGTGSAPDVVVVAVSSHLSARFTASVTIECGRPWEVAAGLAEDAIVHVLSSQVAAAR